MHSRIQKQPHCEQVELESLAYMAKSLYSSMAPSETCLEIARIP